MHRWYILPHVVFRSHPLGLFESLMHRWYMMIHPSFFCFPFTLFPDFNSTTNTREVAMSWVPNASRRTSIGHPAKAAALQDCNENGMLKNRCKFLDNLLIRNHKSRGASLCIVDLCQIIVYDYVKRTSCEELIPVTHQSMLPHGLARCFPGKRGAGILPGFNSAVEGPSDDSKSVPAAFNS